MAPGRSTNWGRHDQDRNRIVVVNGLLFVLTGWRREKSEQLNAAFWATDLVFVGTPGWPGVPLRLPAPNRNAQLSDWALSGVLAVQSDELLVRSVSLIPTREALVDIRNRAKRDVQFGNLIDSAGLRARTFSLAQVPDRGVSSKLLRESGPQLNKCLAAIRPFVPAPIAATRQEQRAIASGLQVRKRAGRPPRPALLCLRVAQLYISLQEQGIRAFKAPLVQLLSDELGREIQESTVNDWLRDAEHHGFLTKSSNGRADRRRGPNYSEEGA